MAPDQPLRVLVSGGGIAGAALACLLAAGGHQVTVVERDQGVRSSGNPVDVRGPAFGVVERLGLVPRLRDLATRVREVGFVDADGRRVASMATRRSQDRELEVPRADLSAALVDAARDEAEFRFDDMIVGLHPDEQGVDVTFERAAPDRFDLVVGADGLHSAVRRMSFGQENAFVKNLGLYVATVRLTDTMRLTGPPEREDTVWMYNEPGAAVAVHPGTGTPIVAFMFRSPLQVDPRDTVAARRLMTETYGNAGWRAQELLTAYQAAGDTYFDTVSQVRLPAWSHGRVTLIGDAASCVSLFGEGSSAAILGAATLADALAMTPQDIPTALTRYEAKHRPASRRGQRAVPIVSHLLIPASPTGITLRNQILRLTGHR